MTVVCETTEMKSCELGQSFIKVTTKQKQEKKKTVTDWPTVNKVWRMKKSHFNTCSLPKFVVISWQKTWNTKNLMHEKKKLVKIHNTKHKITEIRIGWCGWKLLFKRANVTRFRDATMLPFIKTIRPFLIVLSNLSSSYNHFCCSFLPKDNEERHFIRPLEKSAKILVM